MKEPEELRETKLTLFNFLVVKVGVIMHLTLFHSSPFIRDTMLSISLLPTLKLCNKRNSTTLHKLYNDCCKYYLCCIYVIVGIVLHGVACVPSKKSLLEAKILFFESVMYFKNVVSSHISKKTMSNLFLLLEDIMLLTYSHQLCPTFLLYGKTLNFSIYPNQQLCLTSLFYGKTLQF